MSHSVVCYAQKDKKKSQVVLEAFATGCGGKMASTTASELEPGPCAFYGVRPGWLHLWEQAKREGRDWYYLDNSYFDADRERSFRVTKNGLQWHGDPMARLDGTPRFRGRVLPWRKTGEHIVVCEQSDEFMCTVGGFAGGHEWLSGVLTTLHRLSQRPICVRTKGSTIPLRDDLAGAWALVTYSSSAAVEAVLAGVPAFVTGPSAAQIVSMGSLDRIEDRPHGPDIRRQWAEHLARNQWTLDEMAHGDAWRVVA